MMRFAPLLLASGCATVQSLEPVQLPPAQYQRGRPVLVEFVSPEAVMGRCMARGSIFPAHGCADTNAITLPNPCRTPGESYARRACHELGHANGWAANHGGGEVD